MASSEPRKPIVLNSDNVIRSHGDAREYRIQELNRGHPDYRAAPVHATPSLEEALRDLAAATGRAAGRLIERAA